MCSCAKAREVYFVLFVQTFQTKTYFLYCFSLFLFKRRYLFINVPIQLLYAIKNQVLILYYK